MGKNSFFSEPIALVFWSKNRVVCIAHKYIYIYICNVNMGGWRDIYDSIAPKPRIFSSEVQKCPRARPAARGHFLTEDEKIRG